MEFINIYIINCDRSKLISEVEDVAHDYELENGVGESEGGVVAGYNRDFECHNPDKPLLIPREL